MDLRQLRHLVALADYRNFGRAAEAINLSQPAFSRSIQTLERDLDCELVERSSREFRLTGQGELVLQHARRLLAGSQALHNELTQYNGLTSGELQFGCGPYPAQVLVPEALAQFIQAHPAIRTRFHQGDWQQLSLWLREQQIEFLVADARYFVGDPQYHVQLLRTRPGRFFCRAGHPLASQPDLKLRALLDYPVVGTRIPPMIRKILADVLGEPDFTPSVECAQFDAIQRVVLRSDAVGLATLEALREQVDQGVIHLLEFIDIPKDDPALQLSYGIVTRVGYSMTPAARAMVEAILTVDQRLLAANH
ncbi:MULTISPECIES: LysR family transcriptional regulator [unclassified Pseudomonas]|uniref:LysR family transcriptional regulator n=1 Tax=unclassified Pseudomonas TaxID=196821 RepID=UPI001B3223E5|nr:MULTISPECIES: LysR family transcriptional regulator [unclassified Pseudomonas]MBP5948370.1 LysR family transcriptional regulator [Pseudomonas sp. P9(2020)]MBZ9560547.1 LysR family transcriptional regulator [Pseudomonas sp. P116]